MDLQQRKLNKAEWESIEVPVSAGEQDVLKLIVAGYNDVNIKRNNAQSLFSFMKMEYNERMEDFLYTKYFQARVDTLVKGLAIKSVKVDANAQIKGADKIRLSKNDVDDVHAYEHVLLSAAELVVKNKQIYKNYFTLYKLMQNSVFRVNRHVVAACNQLLDLFRPQIDIRRVVENAVDCVELNTSLLKYGDMTLYEHQKEIFTLCKNPSPKLILYMAPTGTGKTLTPIGLAEKHRVLFVCAARHVGVALSRAAISAGKKVAFAFGCGSAADIRLHYSAAKEFIKHRKSGGIGKVDNSVGDDVEIMICDIKSYLPAMFYMRSFNRDENLITYWDEPTITMDYDQHEFHELIHKNWTENLIPNIVLSSATLPQLGDLASTVADFKDRFPSGDVHSIVSHDCKKSIPILNKDGFVVLPHLLTKSFTEVKQIAAHCENYLTLLRYFDLGGVVDFIKAFNNAELFERHFETLDDVNMKNIKMHYLYLLKTMTEQQWSAMSFVPVPKIEDNGSIDAKGLSSTSKIRSGGVYVTTKDAFTLTDGPTIFITDEIEKIAKFCIQQANIPPAMMDELMKKIEFNNVLNTKIVERENELEYIKDQAEKAMLNDVGNSSTSGRSKSTKDFKKLNRQGGEDGESRSEIAKLTKEVNGLRALIKPATLNDTFVPNKPHHKAKWAPDVKTQGSYTSDIDDAVVNEIMLLHGIDDTWKILLMMGIGVFINHDNIAYTEIMKKMADEQKLYMIVASSDYIYGTNYQFCHGYLSKDLKLTQEKLIQAMGRVGRNNIQQTYTVRFRDDAHIAKLFAADADKPEIRNMNALFAQ
jgi:hypothetical protein